jgi:hypothetical protein
MEKGIVNVKVSKARCTRTDVPVIIRECMKPLPSRTKNKSIESGRVALNKTKNLSMSTAIVIAGSCQLLEASGSGRTKTPKTKGIGV